MHLANNLSTYHFKSVDKLNGHAIVPETVFKEKRIYMWIIPLVGVISILLLYMVIPNLWTRLLRLSCIRSGPRCNEVALTFDDGPDPEFTGEILDILLEYKIHATFFVLAQNASCYRELIERMICEGHDVQIHGMTHRFVPLLMPNATLMQIRGAAQCLQHEFGLRTQLYRPTWGLWNLWSWITIRRLKHRLITWSIMVGDWRITPADVLLKRIMHKIHPGGIIVLHDSDKTPGAQRGAPLQVVRLLPILAKAVRENGYEFRTVSEWIKQSGL